MCNLKENATAILGKLLKIYKFLNRKFWNFFFRPKIKDMSSNTNLSFVK